MTPSPEASHRHQILTSIIMVVVGYFCFSCADVIAKVLRADFNTFQLLSVGGAFGTMIAAAWIFWQRGIRGFIPMKWTWHILRGAGIAATSYFAVTALKLLPLTDFYTIIFTSPFLVMILAVLWLGEHVGWRRWVATGVAFSGVLAMAGTQYGEFGAGYVYAFLGALSASINIIIARKIGPVDFAPIYAFYPMLFIFALNITCLVVTGADNPLPHMTAQQIPLFLMHAPFIVLGIIICSRGFALAPVVAMVTPFHYTQIIWGTAFGYFIFGQWPSHETFSGLSLIIAAGLYSLHREYLHKRPGSA
jgi:drug/metabolite transporter (DMT)-like permease